MSDKFEQITDNDKITCNIVDEKQYKKLVNMTLEKISQSLVKSLGYYGSSAIIEDKISGHTASKDGYTILNSFKFQNPIATTIYEIIKKISFNLVQTVGDGSTSSVVIAKELFDGINNAMNDPSNPLSNCPPKIIFDTLKSIEDELKEEIGKVATPITDDNFDVIRKIAEVSNNNDNNVGQNIYDIYKKIKNEGFIYLENSKTNEDHYEILNGIEFASGMVAEDFSNDKNKPQFTAKEARIFMCNDRLDSTDLALMVDSVGYIISQMTAPLVIIARSFSVEFVSTFQVNKQRQPGIQICLVDFNFASKNQEEIFKDIALYTGCEIYDKSMGSERLGKNFYKMTGKCSEIQITNKTTKIIGMNCSQEDIDERVKGIDENIEALKELNDPTMDSRIFQLETRKANLKSLVVKYFVGGDTEFEKNNRKYLIEDSIFACKAALQSGYVSGGNLIIPKILSDNSNLIGEVNGDPVRNALYDIILKSFKNCYSYVLGNRFVNKDEIKPIVDKCINEGLIYNLKTDKYEKDSETDIINSAMTEIEIMKAAFSIIGILVTSNQFIGRAF